MGMHCKYSCVPKLHQLECWNAHAEMRHPCDMYSASCAAQLANKHVVLATLIPTIEEESCSTAVLGYRRGNMPLLDVKSRTCLL